MIKAISTVVLLIALTGCANTRDPNPTQLKQFNDDKMLCEDISVEYKTNTSVATAKIEKNDGDDVQDAIIGTLIWPGLADFKNADGIEGNALLDRNIRLMELAKQIKCDASDYPPQPIRYD